MRGAALKPSKEHLFLPGQEMGMQRRWQVRCGEVTELPRPITSLPPFPRGRASWSERVLKGRGTDRTLRTPRGMVHSQGQQFTLRGACPGPDQGARRLCPSSQGDRVLEKAEGEA